VLIAATQDRVTTLQTILYGVFKKKTVCLCDANINTIEYPSDSIALLIATSGSQAEPKIITISWKNIVSHCRSFEKIIPVNSTSVWLNCMPLNHIAGVMIIYRCWFNHATMILHNEFNVEKVWQAINKQAVSHISLVPRMLFKLLELSQDYCPPVSLKYVLVGGDKLSDSLYQRAKSAGWPIYISYGMTEASSTIAIGRSPDKLKILDGFSVKLTQESVLEIKGDMVTGEADWFTTHDKVKLKNNTLSITGRNDYMIIAGGKNIAPETIESLLLSAPDAGDFFTDIAIGTIKHPNWGDTIVALFCNGVAYDLENWVLKHIPSAYQPRQFIEVDKIPRNSLDKINRKAVRHIISQSIGRAG